MTTASHTAATSSVLTIALDRAAGYGLRNPDGSR